MSGECRVNGDEGRWRSQEDTRVQRVETPRAWSSHGVGGGRVC